MRLSARANSALLPMCLWQDIMQSNMTNGMMLGNRFIGGKDKMDNPIMQTYVFDSCYCWLLITLLVIIHDDKDCHSVCSWHGKAVLQR